MSGPEPTRPLTIDVQEIARFILERTHGEAAGVLLSQLGAARLSGRLRWFPDLVVDTERAEPADLTDGPLPVIPFVRAEDGTHVGEILLWVTGGYLSGIEFAWVTDQPPDDWPSTRDLHSDVPT
jgi:hypothetical protein